MPLFLTISKSSSVLLSQVSRVSGAVQFIGVVVDIRVVVEISSGHHWWTSFRATQATCNHFLHAGVNVALITQCTFDFIFHCCHCNHCNDCALQWLCILHIVLVDIYTMYYILCITQPTSVNASCDHIASLRLLEIQSKVLAFLRSWRWGAAGFADLPLNLRFQSFFSQKKLKKIDFKASGCGKSFTGWPTVAVARLPPRLSKLRR